jgi:hypothetical protein
VSIKAIEVYSITNNVSESIVLSGSFSLSSGQDFITTDQLQRQMRLLEKNADKGSVPVQISLEENEGKQRGDADVSAGKEGGGNQQVMNEMAEEASEGENGLIM